MLLLILSSIFCVPAHAAPPPVLGPPPTATMKVGGSSEKKSAIRVSEIGEACFRLTTASVPDAIRKYCASTKHTRYFWQRAKQDLQRAGVLTGELADALDGDNPCLNYYEKLVQEKERTKENHHRACEALTEKATQAQQSCDAANNCLAQEAKLIGEAADTQKRYAHDLTVYEEKISGFQKGNQKYMARLQEEVKNFSAMPSAQQLQKQSGVSEPLSLGNLRGIDAGGRPVRAQGASQAPNDSYRVDAARTQSVNLTQHQQRLEAASKSAIELKRDLREHREAVQKEKSDTEKTAAQLERNQQTVSASGAGLGSVGSGLLGAASALAGGGKEAAAGGVSAPSIAAGSLSGAAATPASSPAGAKLDAKPAALAAVADNSSASSLRGTLLALNEAMNEKKKPSAKDYSLRDKLVKALQDGATTTGAGAAADTGKSESTKAADAARTLLQAAPEDAGYSASGGMPGSGGGFSLANSETEAQVQKMIGELGDAPAEAAAQTAQTVREISENVSLFLRVTGAYRKILHHGGP